MTAPFLPVRWPVTTPDGADDPTIFPRLRGQTFLLSKDPKWSTAVATAQSGRERRRKLWSYPRWSFKISYEFLRDCLGTPDLQRLSAFFNMHAGRYAEWSFFDPSDNAVTGQAFGVGDGVTTMFQLVRGSTFGGITFTEPVRSVLGTPTIYVAGAVAPVASITAGIVTFPSPPAAGAPLAWDGQFMFLCRFDQDDLDAAQMAQGLWSQAGLAFISLKK